MAYFEILEFTTTILTPTVSTLAKAEYVLSDNIERFSFHSPDTNVQHFIPIKVDIFEDVNKLSIIDVDEIFTLSAVYILL